MMTCRVNEKKRPQRMIRYLFVTMLLITGLIWPNQALSAPSSSELSLPVSELLRGEKTDLLLSLSSVSSPGLAGYDLIITYNASIIKLDLADGTTDFPQPAHSSADGILHLASAQAQGKTGSLVLAHLKVEAVGNPGDSTPLHINVLRITGQDLKVIPATVIHGQVKIKGNSPGNDGGIPSVPPVSSLPGATIPGRPPISMHYAGENRFDTANLIALGAYPGPHQPNIYVANAYAPADALAGAPLAYKNHAPLLLAPQEAKEARSIAEYVKKAMGTEGNITLLGGEGVLGTSYQDQYAQATDRLGGMNREETAVKIAKQLLGDAKGTPMVIVNSNGFADAISIAPIAAQMGWPILLTTTDTLSEVTARYLEDQKPNQIYVIGGPGAVSESAYASLSNLTHTVQRIWGSDRFATNAEVLKTFVSHTSEISFANGDGEYPIDALAGASLGIPIILVHGLEEFNQAQKDYLHNLGPIPSRTFGGAGVIRQDLNWN